MRPPLLHRLIRSLGLALDAVASALSRVVEPVERAFGWLVGRTMAASERVDRVDGLVAGVFWLLLAPVRAVRWLAGKLVPEWLRDALRRMGDAVWRAWFAVVGGAMRAAEWLNLDVMLRWLAWLTWPVWRPVAGLLGFLYAWVVTRDVRQVLWGLPAVLLLVPPLALMIWTATREENWAVPLYRGALEEATEANDLPLIQLYERKLTQLDVDTHLHTYNRALALEEEGKRAEALQLMQRLAPEDERGYPQAHFWLVQHLLETQDELDRDDRDRLVEVHLAAP